MKIIHTIVYPLSQLSDSAKEKAREWYRSGIDYEWYESTYDDAERIGLKIIAFEIERYCEGNFTGSPKTTANLIISEHGAECETAKTAKLYLKALEEIYSLEKSEDEQENCLETATEEFLTSLLEDYRIMLGKEWEYLNSDEQVDESILANEYTFTADGVRFG